MKDKKKIAKIAVSIVLVIAVVVAAVVVVKKQTDDRFKAVIMNVGTGTITQTLSTTGKVESQNKGEFEIFSGVVTKEVFVKLGDTVEKGQLLATFEPSSLDGLVSAKQSDYDNAKINYQKSITSAKEAAAKIPGIEKEIAQLEKQIEMLSALVDSGEADKNNDVPDWVNNIDYARLVKILGNNYTEAELKEYFTKLAKRGISQKTANSFIDNITNIGKGFDISTLLGTSSQEAELMSAELNLMSLKAQKSLLETQSKNVLESTYKSLMDTAERNLKSTKEAVNKLSKGWYAEGDGVISQLGITAGQAYIPQNSASNLDISSILGSLMNSGADVSSLLSSFTDASASRNIGLTVEYYDSFVASFSLGKYDVLDIELGQKAIVTSLGHEFDGEVIYISPVATSSSSGIDIGSMLGSITGGASTSSNTIPAQVIIKNPDKSIIIGIDVDIDINVDTVEDAVVVPIEAVLSDATGDYIFKYNEDNKTVEKVKVELGLASETQYQIVSGCAAGDKIVQNQSSSLESGAKVIATYAETTTASVNS